MMETPGGLPFIDSQSLASLRIECEAYDEDAERELAADLRAIRHVPYAPYEESGKGKEYERLQRIGDRMGAQLSPETP